jgi:hypothetical protein
VRERERERERERWTCVAGVPNRERERERERKRERERVVPPSAFCETHSLIDRGLHMSRGIRVEAEDTSRGRRYE